MLVLEPKRNEEIKLTDSVSGAVVTITPFIRENGNVNLGFDAPRTIKIARTRRSVKDDKSENHKR